VTEINGILQYKTQKCAQDSDLIHVDSQTDGQMDEWTDMTKVIVTFKCEDTLKGLNILFVVITFLLFPKCEK
jgi:hypothetical protein